MEENELKAKLSKCEFMLDQIEFLRHIISKDGIADPKKVKAIQDWLAPKNLKELQCFLGLANYYRCFIENYAKVALQLTKLLCSDVNYVWEADQ